MDILTQERLKELLAYDPETGVFVRKKAQKLSLIGKPAGNVKPHGYLIIKIGKKGYLAHRLAWLFMYGDWPVNDIDHIDHDCLNNRIVNLRDVTTAGNLQNQIQPQKGNTTGFLGVSYRKDRNKYKATIKIHGKIKYLGQADTAENAYLIYLEGKRKHHLTCTI